MNPTIAAINTQTLAFAPAVLAAIQAVEAADPHIPGTSKRQIVLDSIVGVAKVGETIPNANVAGISLMIDMFVSIFNAAGKFRKAPKAA
jgi:flagellar biosynthesis protein FliQ